MNLHGLHNIESLQLIEEEAAAPAAEEVGEWDVGVCNCGPARDAAVGIASAFCEVSFFSPMPPNPSPPRSRMPRWRRQRQGQQLPQQQNPQQTVKQVCIECCLRQVVRLHACAFALTRSWMCGVVRVFQSLPRAG